MKNMRCCLFLMVVLLAAPVCARADLDGFLSGLNNQAHNDMNDYNVRLSVQFGMPLPQVQSLVRSMATPGDAFMCLQLGQMTRLPPDRVLQTYKANRGKVSLIVLIPVERITFLFNFAILIKYGRLVISPDGIFHTCIPS